MFKRIVAKNFMSWKLLDFTIENGVTLITGFNHDDGNSEGSGKSAILNALAWCIKGELPKDCNIDDVIMIGQKDCEVSTYLEDGRAIWRSRKPNDLGIWEKASMEPIRGKDAKQTQQMIDEIVGMSFETFCQSVYFAQNYPKKFITANEAEKSKILSELQDLTQFDKAGKVAHERMRALQTKAQEKLTELRLLLQKAEIYTTQYDNLMRMKANFDLAKNKAISDLERVREFELEKIAKLQSDRVAVNIQSLHDAMEQRIELRAQLRTTLKELDEQMTIAHNNAKMLAAITQERRSRMEEYDILTSNLQFQERTGQCFACKTPFAQLQHNQTDEMKKLQRELEDDIKDLSLRIAELEGNKLEETTKAQIAQTNASILILDNADVKTKEKLTYLNNIEQQLESFHKSIDFLDGKIEEEKAKTSKDIDESLSITEQDMALVKTTANEVNAAIETLKIDIARYDLLKEGFKEVKSFVFQSLLNELNFKANQYLKELFDQNVKIEFKNVTEANVVSKIVAVATIDGVSRPLGLYSGGQFARLQWAVNLALSDIVAGRSHNPINLRIFDEHFKDLSESSMEKIVKLLGKFKGATILIEHNSMVKNIVNQTFEVEYRNGQSNVKS